MTLSCCLRRDWPLACCPILCCVLSVVSCGARGFCEFTPMRFVIPLVMQSALVCVGSLVVDRSASLVVDRSASRRSVITAPATVAALCICCAAGTRQALADEPSIIATGTVALQKGILAGSDQNAALYITVRPAAPEGGAALQAGKVVPLATARFAAPLSFPFTFKLTTVDLTAEYATMGAYDQLDLTVSARYDGDGVAATRGPDDLVGRGLLKKNKSQDPSQWQSAYVELQGRGLTGRLLTGGTK